ncbi:MAG: hypothetical protein KG003_10160 [Bacteroidetes bacterium]|nr:hypothetical protein [Bacteroidota bacterium]
MNRIVLCFVLFFACNANADHIAKFELTKLEWNGVIKTYSPAKKIELSFLEWSSNLVLDTLEGEILMIAIKYEPVYNDTGERPAFRMIIFDSFNREFDLYTATDWKKGHYEAGMKEQDETGVRKWEGALRYTPDTSIHLERPAWRKDNYTFKIGTFRAWNSQAQPKRGDDNRILKDLYFQGFTGERTELKPGGKYGDENYYMMVDPVRYQWAGDAWMEINVRLFRKNPDGSYVEILAHVFSSKDKNVFFSHVTHDNAYEVRDAKSKYYMLMTGVLIIPY